MLAPVVSSILFILVFGLSLGGASQVGDVDYEVFIVPGLITMAMVQAAYANNASTIFQARFDRYINDVLSAPMRAGRWRPRLHGRRPLPGRGDRRIAAGAMPPSSTFPSSGPSRCSPRWRLAMLFSALGIVVGIYAETWDHTTFIANIVILPLAFVGGVFYSIDVLPSPWEELSHVNPSYLVNAVRFGFLGESDVSVWLSLAVTAALAIPVYAWAQYLFTTGSA